jgi:hypothetical protein
MVHILRGKPSFFDDGITAQQIPTKSAIAAFSQATSARAS